MRSHDRLLSYFNAQARLGRTHQHPGGKSATEKLLGRIPALGEGSRVLELGCGAGNTAALLLERCACLYVGIDRSPVMLRLARTATKRFRDRVLLLRSDLRLDSLPVRDNSVDVILAESVIAILESKSIIPECSRVLKPDGVLAWNDRIWGAALPPEMREKLNDISRKVTGFEAASITHATLDDWRGLAETNGLTLIAHERLERGAGPGPGLRGRVSAMVHLVTRLIGHPSTIPVWYREQLMARLHEQEWKRMEDWLFVARKR